MLFLCCQEWLEGAVDLHGAWSRLPDRPVGLRRRYRFCGMPKAVAICDAADGAALEGTLRDSLPTGGHATALAPLEQGFCREDQGAPLSFMLQLGWEAQARALDGLWPEIVQALQSLEEPLVSAAYRLAGRQEAIVFAETACATDLNRLAALRLLHGVAVEQIAVMRAH